MKKEDLRMYTMKVKMMLGLLLTILMVIGSGVVSQSSVTSQTKEISEAVSVRDILGAVTKIAVFQWADKERKYLGSLRKEDATFQRALKALSESQSTVTSDVTRPEYEVVFMGEGFLRLAKYSVPSGVMTFYAPKKATQPEMTLWVNHSFTDLLTSAKLPNPPKENFKPRYWGSAMWLSLPQTLVQAVARFPVILIGKPVDIFRPNFCDTDDLKDPDQYTVYMIEVERYLKDETGQLMPFIKYWEQGGLLAGGYKVDMVPLMRYNQRYILFLCPWSSQGGGMVMRAGKWIRVGYPDEFGHLAIPQLQTPIINGVTEPRDPAYRAAYRFGDGTTLIDKPEGRVIGEIMAAIKQAERDRR
jgi:hypothetical protein